MNTTNLLIILLAAGYILLLVLAITFVVILISILRQVKRITQKAERTTENLGDIMVMVGKRVAPVALSAAVAAALRRFKFNKK